MGYDFAEIERGYFTHTARLAEWIVGLTIGELAFIVSQHLFQFGILFYAFLFFSLLSILIAVGAMYVIAIVEDAKLHAALLRPTNETKPPRKDFDQSFDNRVGKIRLKLVNAFIDLKIFQWLVFSFIVGSVLMGVLVVIFIKEAQNCS